MGIIIALLVRPAMARLSPAPDPPPRALNHDHTKSPQVDLVKPQDASMQHEQIRKFVAGTVADSSPIIPISAVRLAWLGGFAPRIYRLKAPAVDGNHCSLQEYGPPAPLLPTPSLQHQ